MNESNINKLNLYAKEELKKFSETEDKYYLYNSKFANYFIAKKSKKYNKSLKILSWIIEDSENEDTEQMAWIYYHIASTLTSLNAPKISLEYSFDALKIASKRNYFDLLPLIYSSIGSNYYIQNNFSKALENNQKAYHFSRTQNYLFKASMVNNISLCYMNLKDNIKAHEFSLKALLILDNVKHKNDLELSVVENIKGNLGSILHKLGQYNEAIDLLEREVEYYFNNKEYLDLAIPPIIELLQLYQIQHQKEKINQVVSKIEYLEKKINLASQFPSLTEALYNYYYENGMREKAFIISKHLFKKLNNYSNWNIKQSNVLNEILYRDKLAHMKNDARSQKIILKKTIEEKRKSQLITIIVIIVGILLLVLALLIFITIRKNAYKNSLIHQQQSEIETNRNKILENEIRHHQDNIANMAMILTLKTETEKAFLTKINLLKRKKNIDPEQTIKDLQLSVSNLINIDKKIINTEIESDEVNKLFKNTLLDLHPNLTKTDLEFCCYFRLNLSAKEIGSITGLSDVSVRVFKNKIKNKLNLSPIQSVNDYLIQLPL
ncbi:MAG: tetratricopeptide repeat protein [Flavobacteriia bacterium]|nr:tetratricopeptide repeat protein [Flavobacteriia bacterium]